MIHVIGYIIVWGIVVILFGMMFAIIRSSWHDGDSSGFLKEITEAIFGHNDDDAQSGIDAVSHDESSPVVNIEPFEEECPACGAPVTNEHPNCPSCELKLY